MSDEPLLPPLPRAGGDRGVGPRFRLDRPTAQAREHRNNTNEIEELLWSRLRRRQLGDLRFNRQMPIAGFFSDFVCRGARLVIELDGGQHADALEYDARRTALIEAQGHRVLRFWNSDVPTNMDGVLEIILAAAQDMGRAPTPRPPPARGRGGKIA